MTNAEAIFLASYSHADGYVAKLRGRLIDDAARWRRGANISQGKIAVMADTYTQRVYQFEKRGYTALGGRIMAMYIKLGYKPEGVDIDYPALMSYLTADSDYIYRPPFRNVEV